MRQILVTGVAALAIFTASAAQAGGPGGGSPVQPTCDDDPSLCSQDPTDPDGPGNTDPGNPGNGTGGGPTGSGTTPVPYTYGSGATLFNLDSLPTGPEGTQAFYQPKQDYTSIGLGKIASAQGPLSQTVDGLTVAFHTATYAPGGVQTVIRTDNDSAMFNYLGVPTGVQVGIEASIFSGGQPGAVYANFSSGVSYFSINLYRLSGAFDVNSTVYAYSGLNGTGTLLGSVTGSISGGNNFAFTTMALADLGNARSFVIQGGSGLANYDDITATMGVPEPASWALMLGGFGLVGGMMRANRRQRSAVRFG